MADYKISQLTPVTPTSDDLLEVSHTTDGGVTFNTGSVSVADLSSAVADNITAADIEYSSGVSVKDKLNSLSSLVKSVFLTSSMTCNYADNTTIGYRSTTGDKVDITTLTGYPSNKTVLGVVVEYAYVGSLGEYYKIAQLNVVNNETWANSKVGGTVRFGVRVYYLDD